MSCVHRQRLIEGSEEPCGHAARTFCLTARAKAVGRYGMYSRRMLCIMPHANFERAAARGGAAVRGGAADDAPLVLAPRANTRALAHASNPSRRVLSLRSTFLSSSDYVRVRFALRTRNQLMLLRNNL